MIDNSIQPIVDLYSDQIEDPQLIGWLKNVLESTRDKQSFFINFGLIGRKVEHRSIVTKGHFPYGHWSLEQVCRLALLMSIPNENSIDFIGHLLSASDMREQVVIYKSLPHLKNASEFTAMAVDGIRTNMIDVFDAIALDNVFPKVYFSEEAWNQMVLKGIFMERPLYRIIGLDERKNATLSSVLYDFVHERWSAKRPVTPELWRLMPGFIDDKIFEDLLTVLEKDTPLAKQAVLRVLSSSEFPAAKEWYKSNGFEPHLSWEEIGKQIQENI